MLNASASFRGESRVLPLIIRGSTLFGPLLLLMRPTNAYAAFGAVFRLRLSHVECYAAFRASCPNWLALLHRALYLFRLRAVGSLVKVFRAACRSLTALANSSDHTGDK